MREEIIITTAVLLFIAMIMTAVNDRNKNYKE